jgi:hypothetical protein
MLGDRSLNDFILVPHKYEFAVLRLYFFAPVTEKLLILLTVMCVSWKYSRAVSCKTLLSYALSFCILD